MNKKIVEYGNALVEKTGFFITGDDIEENLTGSVENLISFIPNSIKNLLLPVLVLFVFFLAGALAMGFFKKAVLQGVMFFACSLIIIFPGGLIIGVKRVIKNITGDAKNVICYALDITATVYKKAEKEQKKNASIQDTFVLIMCFVVIPAVEKVMETFLGFMKFFLYGLTEYILFGITKFIQRKLGRKKSLNAAEAKENNANKEDWEKKVEEQVKAIEDVKGNIEKIVKAGTGGIGFVLNVLLFLIFFLGMPPVIFILVTVFM